MNSTNHLTAGEIPCCLCGTMILPNAANQCSTCLAQGFDLQGRLQRGPGGAHQITIHQCRQCRRFARTEKHYEYAEPESPELLALCLKHIPALASTAEPRLHLVDAGWVWTEPHSMRFKVLLTIRTEIQNVTVQQRLMVELFNQFKQCPDCNREFTNRTWHALVQLRQRRTDDAPKKGLAALEMALAKNPEIRKNVMSVDSVRNGFDFYFLSLVHAQTFTSYLQRVAPMRIKTSKKMVSEDRRNNTANMKYTVTCDVVPLCRDDLVLIHKSAKGKLTGQLALVTKVSSVIHFMSASPKREKLDDSVMDLSPDPYYKNEKLYTVLQASHRLVPFVVLDVELCEGDDHADDGVLYQGPSNGAAKYALADVQVARESDIGVNDEVFNCVTHLGHLIRPGDVVLGYDLLATVGGDWEMEESFHGNFVMPDVVLVKKSQGQPEEAKDDERKPKISKKKERRRRKENRRRRELEESAARMGFLDDIDENGGDFEAELANDPELAAELSALEQEFAALGERKELPGDLDDVIEVEGMKKDRDNKIVE